MSPSTSVTAVKIEEHVFPPTVKPPGSKFSFFLAGAGERGLEIQGKFIKFTAIGVYLEDKAVSSLASKWKGKSAEELIESLEFYRYIVSGEMVIENKQLSEAVLESIIGMHGVSPAAKRSLAVRLSQLLDTFDYKVAPNEPKAEAPTIANTEIPA